MMHGYAEIIRRNPSYYSNEFIEISKQILSSQTFEKNSSFCDWEIKHLLSANSEARIQSKDRPSTFGAVATRGKIT